MWVCDALLRTGGAPDRTGGLAGYWAGPVMQIQEWRIKKTGGALQRTGGAPDRSGGALYRSGGALQRLAGHWAGLAVHWTGLALHSGKTGVARLSDTWGAHCPLYA